MRIRIDPWSQMMEDGSLVPAIAAGAAGVAAAVGILYTIEVAGVRSADKIDDQLMTKLASKVDGGDAENKFSGSDQTLDSLISAMESAQVMLQRREVPS